MEIAVPEAPAETEPAKVALASEELRRYAGVYVNEPGRWQVVFADGALFLKDGDSSRRLTPLGNHTFSADGSGPVTFQPDAAGNMKYLFTGLYAGRRQGPH